MRIYRQGDVLLREIADLNPNRRLTKEVERDGRTGRVTLAYGEVTGHHHSFALKDRVVMFREDGSGGGLRNFSGGRADRLVHGIESDPLQQPEARRFIRVDSEVAFLEHQEHTTIEVPKGFYEVVIQREYYPGAVRRVED